MMFQAVYDTLLRPDGSLVPMLATEWRWPRRPLVTLTLRDDVTFPTARRSTPRSSRRTSSASRARTAPRRPRCPRWRASTPRRDHGVLNPSSRTRRSRSTSPTSRASWPAPRPQDPTSLGTTPSAPALTARRGQPSVGVKYTFQKKDEYWGEDLPFDTS